MKKRRGYSGPPEWNPYLIQQMSDEEAAPLLWIPQVIGTIPTNPTQPYKYGIPVVVDEDCAPRLGTKNTWLSLTWLVEWDKKSKSFLPTAECKVMLRGNDDSNYGAWVTRCDAREFIAKWDKLMVFLQEFGAREFGLNGEELLNYCDDYLGAYERDYN